LKWLMSKHAPRRFGDKVEVEVSGNMDVKNLSDAELEARTRARLVALGVELVAPLLLPMPGSTSAPVPGVTSAPEPVGVEGTAAEIVDRGSAPKPDNPRRASRILDG